MVTLKDLYDTCIRIKFLMEFYGCSSDFNRGCTRLLQAVRDAVIEEQDIDNSDKAIAMSENTFLGKKSIAALEALEAFIYSTLGN